MTIDIFFFAKQCITCKHGLPKSELPGVKAPLLSDFKSMFGNIGSAKHFTESCQNSYRRPY